MSFTQRIFNRPVTILVLFITLTGLGLYSALSMPVNLFPDVELPMITVSTTYRGAGPTEIESLVSRPLESSLANIGGIEKMSSSSSEGVSRVMIEFNWDVDLTEAANEIRDQLDRVRADLPAGTDAPRIMKFDPSSMPILGIAVRGNRSLEELRTIAEDEIDWRLEQIAGVAQVSTQGGRDSVVRVEIEQNRLEAFGLTVSQVAEMIGVHNVEGAGGTLDEGSRSLLVRTAGEYADLDQISETVVAFRGGRSVALHEIASVEFVLDDPDELVYINGEPAVYLSVQRESAANSVEVAERVRAELARLSGSLPEDVRLDVVLDGTSVVRSALGETGSSLLLGSLFAMIVLYLFLREIRTTVIIAIAIPVSLLMTVLVMNSAGLTLNLLTLSGLILGVGMIVDSSIVILENITRHREDGMDLAAATVGGTEQMITAITASTLTTISVFVPILIFRSQLEVFGILFGDISFTVVVALISSLAVATLLVPVLAGHYIKPPSHDPARQAGTLFGRAKASVERVLELLTRGYTRALQMALRHRLATIVLTAAIFAGSITLLPRIGVILSPPSPADEISAGIEMAPGTRLEVTDRTMRDLESRLRERLPEYENTILIVGGSGGSVIPGVSETHSGTLSVTLPPLDRRIADTETVEQIIRSVIEETAGVTGSISEGHGSTILGSDPVDIVISSHDLDHARDAAARIVGLLQQQFPMVTEPVSSLSDPMPELQAVVDRSRARSAGVTVADLTRELRAAADGISAGHYRSGADEFDIRVSLRPEDRATSADLERILVPSRSGGLVAVGAVASFERNSGPVSIDREDQRRTVHVSGGLAPGYAASELQQPLSDALARIEADYPELQITLAGEFAAIRDTGSVLLVVLGIAIALVFAVMASQFESFRSPFIILFTIPLMLIGVFWFYYLLGESISMFSLMGLVMLAGIVVNNGIVLVDYANQLRRRGAETLAACVEAGSSRFRPVLMTSFTTILGMVPLAFFSGEGGQLTQPVALTIIGGLTSSTLITLLLVPVLYSLMAGTVKPAREA